MDNPVRNGTVLITNADSLADLSTPYIAASHGACTGTLISPWLVLTAAHCVKHGLIDGFVKPGTHVFVGPGRTTPPPDTDPNWPIDTGLIPDGQWPVVTQIAALTPEMEPWRDVAVLTLDRPILHDAYPVTLAKSYAFNWAPDGSYTGYVDMPWGKSRAHLEWGYTTPATPLRIEGYGNHLFDAKPWGSVVPAVNPRTFVSWPDGAPLRFMSWELEEWPEQNGGYFYGYWEDYNSYQGVGHGDSGGPLFVVPDSSVLDFDGQPQRVQIGVSTRFWGEMACSAGEFACGAADLLGIDLSSMPGNAWTDIVSSYTQFWIAAQIDTFGGRTGGFDYIGPCDWLNDRDCDHWYNSNDNCPDDFNLEQIDSDNDSFGDRCDDCHWAPDDQANCNAEAENLLYPPNQHVTYDLRWQPTAVSAILATNREQRPGDRCDPNPCNRTAGEEVALDSTTFGTPGPLECGALLGSNIVVTGCQYVASNQFLRDPIRDVPVILPVPTPGNTRFRYCKCDHPHETESERVASQSLCGCERTATSFDVAYHGMTLYTPSLPSAFDPLIPDTFSSTDETKTQDTDTVWDWTSDLLAIKGTPPPPLPLTGPLSSQEKEQLSIDGILWTHVDSLDLASFAAPFEMRTSHFRAMDVTVRAKGDAKVVGAWTNEPWEGRFGTDTCPNCGFRDPWLLFVRGLNYKALVGLVPAGLVEVDSVVTAPIADLFESAFLDSSIALVGASEAPIWADVSGTRLRGVAVDVTNAETIQTVRATTEGVLVVGGERDVLDTHVANANPLDQSDALHRIFTLSGALGELYQIAWTPGGDAVSFSKNAMPFGEWEPVELSGSTPPRNPVAMTYRHEDRSVYVVESPPRHGPPVARLVQISLDGTVTQRGAWIAGRNTDAIHLSTARNGNLLIGVSHAGRFRAVEVDPSTELPHLLRAAQSHDGVLASPLRSDDAGVTAAVRDSDGSVTIRAVELRAPGHWLPAWNMAWCFR